VTDLLPLIDDLPELKVVLFTFYVVQQREGHFRYARFADYALDATLIDGLRVINADVVPEITLEHALDKAVTHGALLRADVKVNGESERLYFINAEPGRAAVAQIEAGEWQPGNENQPVEILPERPNIYRIYEENIGALTPMIVESLKDAEKEYPRAWIEDAIRVAVEKNARNWRFIEAVLKRRESEGNAGGSAQRPAEQDAEWYLPR
jgi:DnaD/phage-associated family protein